MEFDCRKVYGAENAAVIKKGDKVYAADDFAILKDLVNNEGNPDTIKCIRDTANFRFQTEDNKNYAFAYLVERGAESWRPYKDIDEFISDFKCICSKITGIEELKTELNKMFKPNIWVMTKCDPKEISPIISFTHDKEDFAVYIIDTWYTFEELLDDFTYLNGTPCGIKE